MKVYKSINITIGNTDFTIIFFGKYGLTDDGWYAEYHTHPFIEMHIMHTGSVRLKSQNKEIVFSENNVCIIPPRIFHAIEPLTNIIHKTSVYLEIKKNKKKTEDTYTNFSKLFESKSPAIYKYSTAYLTELIKALNSNDTLNVILTCKIQNLFSLILTEIYEKNSFVSPLDDTDEVTEYASKLLLKIESFFNSTTLKNITEENLAQKLNISTTQLRRLIRKHFCCTFRDLILGYKMELAKDFIKKDELSMNEIAEKLGYETYSGFYRSFKCLIGFTPEEYKHFNTKNNGM